MRGWVRTGALVGFYVALMVIVHLVFGTDNERFLASAIGAGAVGLTIGCACHAWDSRRRVA